jgi:hypothetical protein
VTDVVAPADIDQGFTIGPPRNRLLPLMQRELQLAAESDPTGFRALPPLISPGPD